MLAKTAISVRRGCIQQFYRLKPFTADLTLRFPRLPVPGFTALLTGLGLAAAELGGELPLVITGDEEVTRVPVRAVNKPSRSFRSFILVDRAYHSSQS